MMGHVLNLFAVDNLSELCCTYQLLEVTNLPKNNQYPENLHRLAGMVASSTCKPACVYWREQKAYLATTAALNSVKTKWRLTPHIAVLVPDPKEYQLDYSAIAPDQIKLALRLLSYDIRTALMKIPELWNDTSGSFYFRESMNSEEDSQVDALPGFVYRLHYLPGGKIYISLDPTIRYVDRISLLQRLDSGEEFHHYKFKHFLYKFGFQWYRIQFMGLTENSIAEQLFYSEKDKKTYNVYDYTLQSCSSSFLDYIEQLEPSSPAINYKYPNKNIERYGAAALCFKTYTTNDTKLFNIHSKSILNPAKRLQKSQELIRDYFQGIPFSNSTEIVVSSQLLKKSIERFEVPDLVFGNGKILHVKQHSEDIGVDIQEYGKKRMSYLLDKEAGLLVREPLQPQYIFIPKSLHRSIGKEFQSQFVYQMKQFLSHPYTITPILYNDQNARNLRQQVEAIKRAVDENNIDRGRALLILPENANPDLHNFIKRELFETLHFQCANAAFLKKFFYSTENNGYTLKENLKGKFISYKRYTSLGMLLVNRQWPFALKNPLCYDVYIGIDVLNNIAGFTYIYNGGKDCYFQHYQSGQGEKISEKQVFSILKKDLQKYISQLKLQPRSIVVHRDGRSYAQEEKGFIRAIRTLQQDGFLPPDVQVGVVEIHKTSSARLRLYYERDEIISNPGIGDYFIIDDREGVVCNTGYPFTFSGTANPLHIVIASGDLEIKKVLTDVFALAQLGAWSAPDKAARYPATIKLNDTFLEAIASESDEEAALYSEDESDEEEWSTQLSDEDEAEA